MRALLPSLLMAAILLPATALGQVAEPPVVQADEGPTKPGAKDETEWRGKPAFEVWQAEHRWVRLGMRFYGLSPAEHENALLDVGAGLRVPLTTDFFMGLGMSVAFTGHWNQGRCEDRDGKTCLSDVDGGVDYTYLEPIVTGADGTTYVDGSDSRAVPGSDSLRDQRRNTHVALFALTIGANYELTIPNIQFFRVFQPFIGGGVMIAWVLTYSDMLEEDFVLINNDENRAYDDDNIDPWAQSEATVGGEIYGGFHVNADDTFRFTVELGYHRIEVEPTPLQKATPEYEATFEPYVLSEFRFGGGFEFRF